MSRGIPQKIHRDLRILTIKSITNALENFWGLWKTDGNTFRAFFCGKNQRIRWAILLRWQFLSGELKGEERIICRCDALIECHVAPQDHGKWEIPFGTAAYNNNGVITSDGRYQMQGVAVCTRYVIKLRYSSLNDLNLSENDLDGLHFHKTWIQLIIIFTVFSLIQVDLMHLLMKTGWYYLWNMEASNFRIAFFAT